ncbi:MAG TPA: hypothetical protein VNO79_13265 [Actinomycetota bacterium]|nr:hypothetical protein [Actinomycetota bacterium]
MSGGVLTAREVEAAAQAGTRTLAVEPGTVVTPLARDRAAALGLSISDAGPAPAAHGVDPGTPPPGTGLARRGRSGGADLDRLVLESRVRVVARRVLLRRGLGLGALEELVAAVIARLSAPEGGACPCGREAR